MDIYKAVRGARGGGCGDAPVSLCQVATWPTSWAWPAQDAVPGLVSSPSTTCFVDSAFVAMRTRACSLPPFQMISAAATR
jgi:hypothetical protein